jgi:hypothetical protein
MNDELQRIWKEAIVAFRDSRSLGRDLKLGPLPRGSEAGVLTTRPQL